VTERYVTAAELAEMMGLSTRTIRRMVAAGMPSETWGMARTRRFLPKQAIAWASARSRESTVAARAERSNVEISDHKPDRRANAAPGSDHRGV
jgi:phage terminase Nu1 subunit (DNA packaging protein)